MNRPRSGSPANILIFPTVVLALWMVSHAQTANRQTSAAQTPQYHSVWDGIYTEAQAQRGQALYHAKCSSCHGDQLTGKESDDVPALTGRDFMVEWDGRTVGDLYRKIFRKMPQDDPGTLTPQQTADLVSFLLSFNKFPSGNSELQPESEALTAIRFEARKPDPKSGPRPTR